MDPCREAAPAWQRHGLHGADDQDGVDGAVLDGERVERSAPTGLQLRGRPRPAHRNNFHRHRLCAAWPFGRARGRDDGPILVTVVSTSRLLVVAEMSRARWPSSPSARSCRCLHRGSNAQAVSKTGEAARSLARADGQCKGRHASRRARSLRSRAGAGADIARARTASCACACSMRTGLARAAAGPTESCAACVAGGTPVDGGLVSLGGEEVGDEVDRGVDHLARILAPRRVHCDVCARRVVCFRSGVWRGCRGDLAWRLGEQGGTRAEIAPRDEAEKI